MLTDNTTQEMRRTIYVWQSMYGCMERIWKNRVDLIIPLE